MVGIGGEAAVRIYKEVMQGGVFELNGDTPEEAEHRARLVRALKEIANAGGQVDMPREWL